MKYTSLIFLLAVITACGTSTEEYQEEQPIALKDSVAAYEKRIEAISLLGDTLYTMDIPQARKLKYDSALQVARQKYQQNPDNLENIIWLGRRLAYLGRYQEAIDVYTRGLKIHPESPELLRHRGHRYISTRQFDKAIEDLERSAVLIQSQPLQEEPNGIPIPLPENNRPTTLQFNIFYHLGLSYYLKGDYGKAAQAYEQCLTFSETDDEIAATADWLYMSYRRLGEDEVAEETLGMIKEEMDIRENEGYFERLLMYKGMVEPNQLLQVDENVPLADRDLTMATEGYGVGNFYIVNGKQADGVKIMEDIVEGRHWAAFGYIAAEADLARMKNKLE